MRKGQTEIMGLLVVVILFIFIAMFFLMFSGGDDANPTDVARKSSQVQNFLESYLELTPCYSTKPYPHMKNIIKDCYVDEGGTICGVPCKEYIKQIFEDVSDVYNPNVEYQLEIKSGAETFIIIGGCSGNNKFSATDVVSAGSNPLEAKMLLCQNIE